MQYDLDGFNVLIKRLYGVTLTQSEVEPVLAIARQVSFARGDIMLGIGEPMKKIYLILTGIARSYYLDLDGNDVTKIFIPELSFCMGEAFFTQERSIQSFEALENITALEFSADALKQVIFSSAPLKELYIRALEKTIVYKMHRESSFQIKCAAERYLDFRREYPKLENRVSQSCIASYLGITPVSLSRIRRTIKEEN